MSRRTSATASTTRRHSAAGSPTWVSSTSTVATVEPADRTDGDARRRRDGPGATATGLRPVAPRLVGLVEATRGQGEQVLDRLLGLRTGGADLHLVPLLGAERRDPAQASGRHRPGAGGEVASA